MESWVWGRRGLRTPDLKGDQSVVAFGGVAISAGIRGSWSVPPGLRVSSGDLRVHTDAWDGGVGLVD